MFEINTDSVYYYGLELVFDMYVLYKGVRKYGNLRKAITAIDTVEGAAFYAKELCDRAAEKEYKRFGDKINRVQDYEIGGELSDLEKGVLLRKHISTLFALTAPEQKEESSSEGKESGIEDLFIGAMQIGLSFEDANALTLKELTKLIDSYGSIMGLNKKEEDDLRDFYDTNIRGVGG